ncbi:MAG: deoxyguanosinetriphosphate triphosphohydrolase [Thiotrichaceae bacterium]|nr:deoxyguanosinetriphosphate triphosphohydrolase [Thiotrichaceae bacterium]
MIRPLAPYAAHQETSYGRLRDELPPSAYRSEYQRDRDRIIHATAFRRLEYKTQVFVNHEGDLFRTRLTHSLEVAQISRTVARALQLNEDLTEAIALAHDLGHTPFGHAGQDALNECMQNYGGFEHNLQSLRIVDELEEKYPEFRGLNLTFETREGIIKHCTPKQAKTLGQVAARFLNDPKHQTSLEGQISHLCDEVAYNNHDIDDGLRARLITIRQLREFELFEQHYTSVMRSYSNLLQRQVINETIRRMINEQVLNVIETSHAQIDALQPKNVDAVRMAEEPMVTFSAHMYNMHMDLKQFLFSHLYHHFRVDRMNFKAKRVIRELFEAFIGEPRLLPLEAQVEVNRLQAQLGIEVGKARAISDYIAAMTDRFAIAEHERLFDPSTLP